MTPPPPPRRAWWAAARAALWAAAATLAALVGAAGLAAPEQARALVRLTQEARRGRPELADPPAHDELLVLLTHPAPRNLSRPRAAAHVAMMAEALRRAPGSVGVVEAYVTDPDATMWPVVGVTPRPVSAPVYGHVSVRCASPQAVEALAVQVLPALVAGLAEAPLQGRHFAFHAKRSTYTEYGAYTGPAHPGFTPQPRTWPAGARSPYVVTVTAFPKPRAFDGVSVEEWAAKTYFPLQSPMSEAMQPRARYVRNLLVRALSPDAPALAAVVVECWPSAHHVWNPFLFYGAPDWNVYRLLVNMAVMATSVSSFTDMTRIHQSVVGEYLYH